MQIPISLHPPQKMAVYKSEKIYDDYYSISQSQSRFEESISENSQMKFTFEGNFKEILTQEFPKKTMNITWCNRCFCLTSTRLIYYSDLQKQTLKGCFNIPSLLKYNLRINAEYPIITLSVSVPQQQQFEERQLIKLFIQSRQYFSVWRDAVSQNIQNCKNERIILFSPETSVQDLVSSFQKVNGKNFWNQITISMQEFECYADHLDIVLFRSKRPISAFHRLMMRSHYDHVGVVIKDEMNRIFILQVIESRGVWLNEWKDVLPSLQENYEQISYRKLIHPNKVNQQVLEQFLNEVIGRKYELSISKLLNISQEQSESPNTTRTTYFCSQLIADIYIRQGLIKSGKKNDFWPKDFEESLELSKGACLSPIMQIQLH